MAYTNARIGIVITYLFIGATALPLPQPSVLDPIIPEKGTTLQDEIRCYSLPYGGIGFLSHFLTYWAVIWLGFGRRPYWPLKRLSAGKTDLVLSLIQLVVSISIASFTISRCRNRWQFMLIAIWKLVMSMEVGIWGLRASYLAIKHHDSIYHYERVERQSLKSDDAGNVMWKWTDWTPYTLIVYSMAMIVGMVGLMSVVWELRHDREIIQITAAFGSVTGFIVLACAIMMCCCCGFGSVTTQVKLGMAMAFTVIMVCALYSDWILGDIAGSLVGVPSGDNSALYWAYFAAKRLPLLMT